MILNLSTVLLTGVDNENTCFLFYEVLHNKTDRITIKTIKYITYLCYSNICFPIKSGLFSGEFTLSKNKSVDKCHLSTDSGALHKKGEKQ